MEKKFHTIIEVDKQNINQFKEEVGGIKVIRSFELVTIAYELGLFKKFVLNLPDPKKTLLEGLLWGVKLNGCSVSEKDIKETMKIENLA